MIDDSVTVVLNGFKRSTNLDKQIKAIQNQSVKVKEIMLWYNNPGSIFKYNFRAIKKTTAAVSNHNFGVWSRFFYSLNAKTKYICIFDDDTIPGTRWIENCLNTIKTHCGILGTIGLIFDSRSDYYEHKRYGWANPNEEIKQVDLVGHSWFFEKKCLSALCQELPDAKYNLCGEDMTFSYAVQKYLGLNTYVPPHPLNDKSMWGSLYGKKLGIDKHAISRKHIQYFPQIFFKIGFIRKKIMQNSLKKESSFGTFSGQVNLFFNDLIWKGWKLISPIKTKNFIEHFYILKNMLKNGEHFAFNRFSDGELFILQGKRLVLSDKKTQVDKNEKAGPIYSIEDHKDFDPEKHGFLQKNLTEVFKFDKKNYFKGLTCRNSRGDENFQYQLDLLENKIENCTWANVLINGNYKRFLTEMYPLFSEYKVVFICNEIADLSKLDFIVKDFRVGYNAMINDIHKIDEIKLWIQKNNIKNHLFLFSASTFSKIAIYELYKDYDQNTYIDIGTSLNHLIGMKIDRDYLKEYHCEKNFLHSDLNRIDIW